LSFYRNVGSASIGFAVASPSIQNTIPASATTAFHAYQGAPFTSGTVAGVGNPDQWIPLPIRFRLMYHDYFLITLFNAQAGDTFGNMTVWGNEWLMP
jgi:hypothetical protein